MSASSATEYFPDSSWLHFASNAHRKSAAGRQGRRRQESTTFSRSIAAGEESVGFALRFHESIPRFAQTKLVSLSEFARELGLGAVYVKDESSRFGLNSFKGLGVTYAVGRHFQKKLADEIEQKASSSSTTSSSSSTHTAATPTALTWRQIRAHVNSLETKPTFVTATDGNHGRAVAHVASSLQCPCRIYVPRSISDDLEKLKTLKVLQGTVVVNSGGSYDEAVALAENEAQSHADDGWVLIQDTVTDGDDMTTVMHIMQGYSTMLAEIFEPLIGEDNSHLLGIPTELRAPTAKHARTPSSPLTSSREMPSLPKAQTSSDSQLEVGARFRKNRSLTPNPPSRQTSSTPPPASTSSSSSSSAPSPSSKPPRRSTSLGMGSFQLLPSFLSRSKTSKRSTASASSRVRTVDRAVTMQVTSTAPHHIQPLPRSAGEARLQRPSDGASHMKRLAAAKRWPTHVFLQAGVGSFASSMTHYIRNCPDFAGLPQPFIGIVEPRATDKMYRAASHLRTDVDAIGGSGNTCMDGLNCGTASPIAWEILCAEVDGFFSVADDVTRLGMDTLGKPSGGDTAVISGESGAVTGGLLYLLMTAFDDVREQIGLDESSRVLLFSTEGDTNPRNLLDVTMVQQAAQTLREGIGAFLSQQQDTITEEQKTATDHLHRLVHSLPHLPERRRVFWQHSPVLKDALEFNTRFRQYAKLPPLVVPSSERRSPHASTSKSQSKLDTAAAGSRRRSSRKSRSTKPRRRSLGVPLDMDEGSNDEGEEDEAADGGRRASRLPAVTRVFSMFEAIDRLETIADAPQEQPGAGSPIPETLDEEDSSDGDESSQANEQKPLLSSEA